MQIRTRGRSNRLIVLMLWPALVAVSGLARAEDLRTCLPAYWGGLLAGLSTDSEVTELYGTGRHDASQGETGARTFVDASKSATLIVELGTDRVVSSVEVREGVPAGLKPGEAKRMVATRFRPTAGVGVHFGVHLGDSPAAVRDHLGSPTSIRSEGDTEVWGYESSCACELSAGLSFRFLNGRLVSFSVWQLSG